MPGVVCICAGNDGHMSGYGGHAHMSDSDKYVYMSDDDGHVDMRGNNEYKYDNDNVYLQHTTTHQPIHTS